ncbi:MAG: hypothetical protein L0177_00360 [Chloroflexi bacterium]|nr:hypothetical protein [Chloroflexota bacterium]
MVWVTWRQYRLELIIGLALIAALAAFLVPTGIQNLALYRDSGLAACLNTPGADCSDLARKFIQSYSLWNVIVMWFPWIPAIIGPVLAAPIVLEFEQRTYRLAWTQSVTRWRWLATKVALALLGAAVFAVLFTALTTWWHTPQSLVRDAFAYFHLKGAMPLVYTFFALALALAASVFSRRTIVMVVVTLVAFFFVQVSVGEALRPHYLAPLEQTETISGSSLSSEYWSPFLPDRAWFISGDIIDRAGNVVSETDLQAMCGNVGKNVIPCLESHGLMHKFRFHPADRFWTFQAIEAAIYLGAAVPLLGLTVWVVKRRMR